MSPAKKAAAAGKGGSASIEVSPFDPNYDDDDVDDDEGVLDAAANNNGDGDGCFYSDDEDDGGDSDEGVSEELRRDFVDEDAVVPTERGEEAEAPRLQRTNRTRSKKRCC